MKEVTEIIMATVKRHTKNTYWKKPRRIFRSIEPGLSKDVNMYIEQKIHKYIDYLDSIDTGLYCIEYDNDIPTKEELLEGIDQHNYVDGDGSYRLRQRYIEEEQIRIEREFELKRIAEQKKQEAYEKTPAYLLEVQRKQKELEKKQKELEKKQKKEDKDYWEQYDKIVRRTNNYLKVTPTKEGISQAVLKRELEAVSEGGKFINIVRQNEAYINTNEEERDTIMRDAVANMCKIRTLFFNKGRIMDPVMYDKNLELLYVYTARVIYIKKLMEADSGDR